MIYRNSLHIMLSQYSIGISIYALIVMTNSSNSLHMFKKKKNRQMASYMFKSGGEVNVVFQ